MSISVYLTPMVYFICSIYLLSGVPDFRSSTENLWIWPYPWKIREKSMAPFSGTIKKIFVGGNIPLIHLQSKISGFHLCLLAPLCYFHINSVCFTSIIVLPKWLLVVTSCTTCCPIISYCFSRVYYIIFV